MKPTNSDVHVDQALTNMSVAYMQEDSAFIADKVFPVIPVAKQSDKYYIYNRNDFFRDEAKKRAPGTESAGGEYGLSTDSFFADVWAFHKDVAEQTSANEDEVLDGESDAAEFTIQKLMIRRERQFVTKYMSTGVWTTDKTGGTDFVKWDDEAASDPIEDVKDGRLLVAGTTGFKPNTMTVSLEVHEALKKHPLVLERFKYTSSESITAEMIARLLELDNYYVASSIYATNEEGATAAYSFAVGKVALLCYVNPAPSRMKPSAGYVFGWQGFTGASDIGIRTNRIDVPLKQAIRVESEMAFDMKKVAADLGYFFDAVVD